MQLVSTPVPALGDIVLPRLHGVDISDGVLDCERPPLPAVPTAGDVGAIIPWLHVVGVVEALSSRQASGEFRGPGVS